VPKRLSLIIGIVLAILATVLTKLYLDQRTTYIEKQAQKAVSQIQQNQTAVLVAKRDIPKGAYLDASMLQAEVIPNRYVSSQAVTSFDRIAGMAAIATIPKGEQVTLTKLMPAREAATISLAMATPMGKRAVTIPVDNISSLGGMIKPGDYVDVLGAVPIPAGLTPEGKTQIQEVILPLFQNILVLSVGQDLGVVRDRQKAKKSTTTAPIITLALSPQEASLIAFVQGQSKIRLVLRSPADSKIYPVQPASWETLLQYLNLVPQELKKKEEKEEEIEPEVTIEIYRGLQKGTIPLSK